MIVKTKKTVVEETVVCDLCENGFGYTSDYNIYSEGKYVFHKECKEIMDDPDRYENLIKKSYTLKQKVV